MSGTSRLKSRLGAIGIWSLELRSLPNPELAARAIELEGAGWDAVWIVGANGPGLWRDAETILDTTSDLTVAFGVMSIWGADAEVAASEHARLISIYGERLVAGLGVSNPRAAVAAGKTYTSAIASMNAYLDALDGARAPLARESRILGALGPRMTRLAGRRTAGVHPFLVTPASNRRTRALLGPDALLLPHQAVVLERDPARAREIARRGIGMYLRFPTYQQSLLGQGFSESDLADNGSDRLIDALVAWGSVTAIESRIHDHLDAGADHVALQVLTDTPDVPVSQWSELAELIWY